MGEVDKLTKTVVLTELPLIEVKSVFPFDLFPNSVTLDRKQVTITYRYFFQVMRVVSVQIQDILSAEVNAGPFFGSLDIVSRFFTDVHHKINWMWRGDAIKLRRLIQGAILAHHEEIDIINIPRDELLEKLYRLGE